MSSQKSRFAFINSAITTTKKNQTAYIFSKIKDFKKYISKTRKPAALKFCMVIILNICSFYILLNMKK